MREVKRIEDIYLNHLRRGAITVCIKLKDGRSLSAIIIAFDPRSIVVDVAGSQHLLYKAGIVEIEPQESVSFIFNDRGLPSNSYARSPYTSNYA
ncbi:MAG TPA: hypothetical protein GXZ89_08635 [Fastidiosipila sp.]|nr:hypothetical protein [Fastidiosipila sp.]